MKKVTYIYIATLTFLVGVFGYCTYLFLIPVKVYETRNVIPLYELEKNPQNYLSHKFLLQEKLVVIKEDNGSFDYYVEGDRDKCVSALACDNTEYLDCILTTSLEFVRTVEPNEVEMIKEIAEKNHQAREDDSRRGRETYGAKVEIEGYVGEFSEHSNYFKIKVTSIKQISPVEVFSE